MEPGSLRTQGAQYSQRSTLPAKTHTVSSAPGDSAPSVFDPTLEYSTERVVLFWQPPFYFSPRFPSSVGVDDVSYSCAEQYMMAEKARLLGTTTRWSGM